MKILWLCNIVLPEFCEEFEIKRTCLGGWMTAMLHELEKRETIETALCFPVYDTGRLKSGEHNGHRYYSFLCDSAEVCSISMVRSFVQILGKDRWDLIHIWGTEYAHTLAMLKACDSLGILGRAVINIQGLAYMVARHYRADIPEKYWIAEAGNRRSMKEEQKAYEHRGQSELESIKMARYAIGRTDWDRAGTEAVNPQIRYFFCGEILRESFYEYAGAWRYEKCQKHSIFVSQASYPIKGFHYLLQALPDIIRKYPDTQVYVAGTGILAREEPYAVYLRELIRQFQLEDRITFLGMLDEEHMIRRYCKANVFVSASVVENESNSLHEAQIIGVPCVCSYVGGAYNSIRHKEDGFLYPHDEPVLLAYYICKLFADKDGLCTRISANTSREIQKYVCARENADRTVSIYQEILLKAEEDRRNGRGGQDEDFHYNGEL